MTIEERCKLASDLKKSGMYNCCQAVTKSLYDLTDLSEQSLLDVSSSFGTGMGNMEATCGALIGANMILSLIIKQRTTKYSKELSERFKEKSKATICKILKGVETKQVLTDCPDCCFNAVKSMFEVLDNNNISYNI